MLYIDTPIKGDSVSFRNLFGAGSYNSMSINGLKVQTNLNIAASGNMIRFGDGSWYKVGSDEYYLANPDSWIVVNGHKLTSEGSIDVSDDSDDIGGAKPAAQSYEYSNVRSIMIDVTSADVTVEPCEGETAHVEVSGPKSLVDGVKVRKSGTAIVIDEESSSSGGMFISTGNVQISGVRSGNIRINGLSIGSDGALMITAKVPYGTHIVAECSGSGDITVGDVNGELDAATSGSGDISVGKAHGNVDIRSSGSGDVSVRDGKILKLTARTSGSGDISVGGIADDAELRSSGSGDISVKRVINPPIRKSSGSGDIRVRNVG